MKNNSITPSAEPAAPAFVEIESPDYCKGNQFTETGAVFACLEQCAMRQPLVTLNTFIGYEASMRPAELRALAAKLVAIADHADARPMGKRTFRRVYRRY